MMRNHSHKEPPMMSIVDIKTRKDITRFLTENYPSGCYPVAIARKLAEITDEMTEMEKRGARKKKMMEMEKKKKSTAPSYSKSTSREEAEATRRWLRDHREEERYVRYVEDCRSGRFDM